MESLRPPPLPCKQRVRRDRSSASLMKLCEGETVGPLSRGASHGATASFGIGRARIITAQCPRVNYYKDVIEIARREINVIDVLR